MAGRIAQEGGSKMKRLMMGCIVCVLMGCGDGGPTAPSAPPVPLQANVSLFSTANVYLYFTIRESAGVRANINWLRGYCDPGSDVPYKEFGSSFFLTANSSPFFILNGPATNVAQGGELSGSAREACGHNNATGSSVDFSGRSEVNYTDASGQYTVASQ